MALTDAVSKMGKSYAVNEGDGAFYDPKLDFQLPRRFNIEYVGADGEKHRPVMIHQVIFGSIERFIGILIEHYAGKFPLWLSPTQARELPASVKYLDYAKEFAKQLQKQGIHTETDPLPLSDRAADTVSRPVNIIGQCPA